MVDAATSSLISLFVFSHSVRAHVRGPKNLGDAGRRLHKMAAWLTPRNNMCYCTKYGRSKSNRFGVGSDFHLQRVHAHFFSFIRKMTALAL